MNYRLALLCITFGAAFPVFPSIGDDPCGSVDDCQFLRSSLVKQLTQVIEIIRKQQLPSESFLTGVGAVFQRQFDRPSRDRIWEASVRDPDGMIWSDVVMDELDEKEPKRLVETQAEAACRRRGNARLPTLENLTKLRSFFDYSSGKALTGKAKSDFTKVFPNVLPSNFIMSSTEDPDEAGWYFMLQDDGTKGKYWYLAHYRGVTICVR